MKGEYFMRKFISVIAVISLTLMLSFSAAFALNTTFFGEDLDPDQNVANAVNSNAARADFFSYLVGVGTEDFESFLDGQSAPLTVDFGAAGEATLNGGGAIQSGYSTGRWPVSGSKYWEASTGTGMFSISFEESIAAFGFYGTDIGDFSGQITLTTVGGTSTVYNIPHTIGAPNASILYWGVINDEDLFSSISFSNTGSSSDWFGFDDFSIGTIEQVVPTPEPATMLLLGFGLLGLVGLRRR